MPATPARLKMTGSAAKSGGGGGMYSLIEVPGDYAGTITDVEDYKTERSKGWKLHIDILGCNFNVWLSLSEAARWKIEELLAALGHLVQDGDIEAVDPNSWIGQQVGCAVDLDDSGRYREIHNFFFLDDEEDEVTPPPAQEEDDLEVF